MSTLDERFDFAEWLAGLGHGSTNQRAGDRLREVVTACRESGGKGKLVLTLDVSYDDLADIKPSIKITKPDRKLPGGNYFATDEGELVTQDPRQLSLPATVLPKPRIVKPDSGGAS